MRAVIIDDEQDGRASIERILNRMTEVSIIGMADDVQSGRNLIEKSLPDIVFLDIQLKSGTGFDLLKELNYKEFHLIFCTAHDEFALKAFQNSAIDYLLKPVAYDDVVHALAKINKMSFSGALNQQLDILLNHQEKPRRIAIHSSKGIKIVDVSSILYATADSNYCVLHIREQTGIKTLMMSKTLKDLTEMLNNDDFIRIHQKNLINISHVQEFLKAGDGGKVVMSDQSILEVSRRKKDEFLEKLLSR